MTAMQHCIGLGGEPIQGVYGGMRLQISHTNRRIDADDDNDIRASRQPVSMRSDSRFLAGRLFLGGSTIGSVSDMTISG